MPESDNLSIDVRVIKEKVTSLESLMDVLVVASKNDVLPLFLDLFGRSRKRALAYIAADGIRTVGEIAEIIEYNITHTSTYLGELENAMLLKRRKVGREIIYEKKKWDVYLGLSDALKRKFEVEEL